MCGRYTLSNPDPKRLRLRFGVEGPFEFDERPRFNIAPTDAVLAVRREPAEGAGEEGRQFGYLRWGLVPGRWAEQGRPLINARAETVATQPAYRESFARRRCLLPADGFYEWRKDPDGKQPVWLSRADGELFAFAGIWSPGREEGGESCALLTCEPNATVRPIHDRMPVVLEPGAEERWIDPEAGTDELLGLLRPAPEGLLTTREVADAVNDVREDGPHLLGPPMKLF